MEKYVTRLPEHFRAPDGARIGYFTRGNKSNPAIFLHNGLACNPIIFKHVIDRFQDRFFFIYMADRGHMDSTPGSLSLDDLNVGVLAEDTRLLMEHLGVKRAIQLGFSMGVAVTFEFYRRYPKMCTGFIVMGGTAGKITEDRPGGKFFETALLPFIEQTLNRFEVQIQTAWQKSNFFDNLGTAFRYVREDGPRLNPREVRLLFRHFAHIDPRTYLAYGNSLTEQDARTVLPEIKLATLIFGGGRDMFVPLSIQRKLHDSIADSTLVIFEQGSHLFPLSYAPEITDALEEFFEQHDFRYRWWKFWRRPGRRVAGKKKQSTSIDAAGDTTGNGTG